MFAALIGAAARAGPALPLESESFSIDVTGDLAEAVIVQRFRNTATEPVDATWVFPLYGDARIRWARITAGDRILYATAGAAVADLPPGQEVDVEVHADLRVGQVDGEWRLVVPLATVPRLERPGELLAPTSARASVVVEVGDRLPIHALGSPSCSIPTVAADGRIGVAFDDLPLDRDFVLTWRTTGAAARPASAGRAYEEAVPTVPSSDSYVPGVRCSCDCACWLLEGANITDPVTGTFWLNFDFDATAPPAAELEGRLPEHPQDVVAAPEPPSATNTLELHGALGGQLPGTPLAGGHAAASVSGPVVRDSVWFGGSAEARGASLGGVDVRGVAVRTEITGQSAAANRFTLIGSADPSSATAGGGATLWGGGQVEGDWSWFPGSRSQVRTSVSGSTRRLGDADQRTFGLSAAYSALSLVDPLGGIHDLGIGAEARTWRVTSPGRSLAVRAGSAFAQDMTHLVHNLALGGGVRLDSVNDAIVLSPRLFARWDPWSDGRTSLTTGYARYVDPERSLPTDLADQALPITDEVSLELDRELVSDVFASAGTRWQRRAFAFAPDPQLVLLPPAPVDTVHQRTLAIELGLRKIESRRWRAGAGFELIPQPEPVERGLLSDPAAPWVPGFLDAYRRYGLSADLAWALPIDPFATHLTAFARWGSRIGAGGPEWWLGDSLSAGAGVTQDVFVREGSLRVSGSVAWVRDDPAASWLPLEVVVLVPGAPSVHEQPPLRVEAELGYDF